MIAESAVRWKTVSGNWEVVVPIPPGKSSQEKVFGGRRTRTSELDDWCMDVARALQRAGMPNVRDIGGHVIDVEIRYTFWTDRDIDTPMRYLLDTVCMGARYEPIHPRRKPGEPFPRFGGLGCDDSAKFLTHVEADAVDVRKRSDRRLVVEVEATWEEIDEESE